MTGSRRHVSRVADRWRQLPPYVEKVLLPPGDIAVMDNLGNHIGKIVRQLICSAGAKLFFPPKYSPDLNPIEQVFAKLKHFSRKAAARTIEAVCLPIGKVLKHHRRMRKATWKTLDMDAPNFITR
jgi:transposase